MNTIKIIIEIKDGCVQEVCSNAPILYAVVNYDSFDHNTHSPVSGPHAVVQSQLPLHSIYHNTDPQETEIREDLKRIKF